MANVYNQTQLECMAPECTSEYSQRELQRCLSPVTYSKLEELVEVESLNKAHVRNLVKCPYCNLAAVLPQSVKVFECYRDGCGKKTCRDCGADWEDHRGRSCTDVEGRDETALRKEYEEKMTKAKVRTCNTCKTQFTKEGGCNKMVCRCGTAMCYICRTPRIQYNHFCNHLFTTKNKNCNRCQRCYLWTDAEYDDEIAIQEIQAEANAMRRNQGFMAEKIIGVPANNREQRNQGLFGWIMAMFQ